MSKLQGAERKEALAWAEANGWTHEPGRDAIVKTFKFGDFAEAWGWMSRIAVIADKMDHHPEWANVYNRVEVTLVTHDVDGLSDLDLTLARKMESAAG